MRRGTVYGVRTKATGGGRKERRRVADNKQRWTERRSGAKTCVRLNKTNTERKVTWRLTDRRMKGRDGQRD